MMEYGWILFRMLAVLAAVCALAYVFLRWGVRRLVAFNPSKDSRLAIVERLGVAPKRSLLVVRAGEEFWLVGSSEAGLQMLGALEPELWQKAVEEDETDVPGDDNQTDGVAPRAQKFLNLLRSKRPPTNDPTLPESQQDM